MVDRDERGRIKPGSVLNEKGRLKRTDEEKYTSVISATITPDRFRAMLEKQAKRAEAGDLEAFKQICKLLGLDIEKKELTGKNGEPLIINIGERP
jgi:hypothetical protein